VIAIMLAVLGFLPDFLRLTNQSPIWYPEQPFQVTDIQRGGPDTIALTIHRTICYQEPWPFEVLSFPITARALVSTRTGAKHFLPPGEGFAGPGCRQDDRTIELDTTAPPGSYFLEGISDAQTRWGRTQVYWRTVDFQVP
jgi:hypothetical protein